MFPLHQDSHFTFWFADDRIIAGFHLEGVEADRRVLVSRGAPPTTARSSLLAARFVLNELIAPAKLCLAEGGLPRDVGNRLIDILLSALAPGESSGYGTPRGAFAALVSGIEGGER